MQPKYDFPVVSLLLYTFSMVFCCCCFSFIQVLLELGADPRMVADDGAYPEQVSVYSIPDASEQ